MSTFHRTSTSSVGTPEMSDSKSVGPRDDPEKSHDFKHSLDDVPSAFERKTMRKVDLRVLPFLALLYMVALVDRLNVSAARTAGMGVALELTVGSRYSVVTCMYFVPYILLQVPGNFILRKVGVRSFLTFIVFGWGAVSFASAWVKTWKMLVLCRVLLGAFEAGMFPALVYLISTWYRRHETQKRMALFYMLSLTIAGFAPILAYALSRLDGTHGIAGWSWIFIIEGAFTMGLGVLTYFFVPDFPDKNGFLTAEQTALVLARIELDRGDSIPDALTFDKVLFHMKDWTIWTYGIMLACASTPSYMLAYFISIILAGQGHGETASLLLSAPPYGPAFASALIIAYFSDRMHHRSGFIIAQALVCIIGCCLTAFHSDNNIRYLGTFFINIGSAGAVPGILAFGANNVVSQSKRAVQSALTSGFAGIGGIIASTVFRQQDYPKYIPGLWVTIGTQIVLIAVVSVDAIHFSRLNRLQRQGKLKEPIQGQEGFYHTL